MNDALRNSYIEESSLWLTTLTPFLTIPVRLWDLAVVTRGIHTLKGISGTVGFPNLNLLGSRLEDILDSGIDNYEAGFYEGITSYLMLYLQDVEQSCADWIDADPSIYDSVYEYIKTHTHKKATPAQVVASLFNDNEEIIEEIISYKEEIASQGAVFREFDASNENKISEEVYQIIDDHSIFLQEYVRDTWNGDSDDITFLDMLTFWKELYQCNKINSLSQFVIEVKSWVEAGEIGEGIPYMQTIRDCILEISQYTEQLIKPKEIVATTLEEILTPITPPPTPPAELLDDDVIQFNDENLYLVEWPTAWENRDNDVSSLKRVLHTMKGTLRTLGAITLGNRVHSIEQTIEKSGIYDNLNQDIICIYQDMTTQLNDWTAYRNAVKAYQIEIKQRNQSNADKLFTINTIGDQVTKRINMATIMAITDSYARQGISQQQFGLGLKILQESHNEIDKLLTKLQLVTQDLLWEADKGIPTQGITENTNNTEFDRYTTVHELTRMVVEVSNDLKFVQKNMVYGLTNVRTVFEDAKLQMEDISNEVTTLRMEDASRSLDSHCRSIIERAIKDDGQGKDIEFISETHISIDDSLISSFKTALEHLIRNSVSHGIETPKERLAANKKSTGTVHLKLEQSGNQVIATLKDNGRGVNIEAVRKKAVKQNLWPEGVEMSSEAACEMIFKAGFSTTEQVSVLSGRGVGMDAVRDAIVKLGGRIEVSSVTNIGTSFKIIIPSSIAMVSLTAFSVDDQWLSVPVHLMNKIESYNENEINNFIKNKFIQLPEQDTKYTFITAYQLLGNNETMVIHPKNNRVIFVKDDQYSLAILVTNVAPEEKYIAQQLSSALTQYMGIMSATIRGDGKPMLIIDPLQIYKNLLQKNILVDFNAMSSNDLLNHKNKIKIARDKNNSKKKSTEALILIVDDSATIRAVSQSYMHKLGYKTEIAKDGLEAFEMLTEKHVRPECILLDIEMPRMNGFELLDNIRKTPSLASIPVIMISSRSGKKHHDEAIAKGANAFFGKPYPENELQDKLKGLLTGQDIIY